MTNLLTEAEFTERFTEAIKHLNISTRCKENMVLELSFGENEPALALSLEDAFASYQIAPNELETIFKPYIQDLSWSVQSPRFKSKELYENIVPIQRNFSSFPPSDIEFGSDPNCPKGPIVFDDLLRAGNDYLVLQFQLLKDNELIPLRKGDILPCMPDATLMTKLSLHNLALLTERAGISATPLKFAKLEARTWYVSLGDEKLKNLASALSCIPQVMKSLEESFEADDGLIAIMPAPDQFLVSIDTDEKSICELGMLAKELKKRAPWPLTTYVWRYVSGALTGVQDLTLEEVEDNSFKYEN